MLSLIVAICGVVVPGLVQILSLRTQLRVKQYEVTFLEKRKNYAELLESLDRFASLSTSTSAGSTDDGEYRAWRREFNAAWTKVDIAERLLEPFIRTEDRAEYNRITDGISEVVRAQGLIWREKQYQDAPSHEKVRAELERRAPETLRKLREIEDFLLPRLFPDSDRP